MHTPIAPPTMLTPWMIGRNIKCAGFKQGIPLIRESTRWQTDGFFCAASCAEAGNRCSKIAVDAIRPRAVMPACLPASCMWFRRDYVRVSGRVVCSVVCLGVLLSDQDTVLCSVERGFCRLTGVSIPSLFVFFASFFICVACACVPVRASPVPVTIVAQKKIFFTRCWAAACSVQALSNGARARDIIAGHRCGKRFASCHPQAHDLFGAVWRRHWLLRWRSHRSVLVQRPGVREQKRSQTFHLRGRWRGSSLSFLAAVVALVSRAPTIWPLRLCGFELTALRHRPTPLPAAWAAEAWAAEDRDFGLSSTHHQARCSLASAALVARTALSWRAYTPRHRFAPGSTLQ